MSNKKPRRSSLIGSLQILGKSAFGGHHKQTDGDNKASRAVHESKGSPRKRSWPSISRSSTTRTISDSHRESTLSTSTRDSFHIPDEQDHGLDYPKLRAAGANSRTRLLSPRTRCVPSASSDGSTSMIPPAQASMPCLSQQWSRLPTPSYLPDGGGYSHEVYKNEGRRSVLSSIGKKYSSLRRSLDKTAKLGTKCAAGELEPSHGKYHNSRRITSDSGLTMERFGSLHESQGSKENKTARRQLPRVFSLNTVGKLSSTKRSHTMIPLPKSGTMLSLHSVDASDTPRPPQLSNIDQTPICPAECAQQPESAELEKEVHGDAQETTNFAFDKKRSSLRKVRATLQSLPRQSQRQLADESCKIKPQSGLSNTMAKTKDEMTPKEVLSQGLQSLRTPEKASPGVKISRSEVQPQVTVEPRRQIKTDVSQIPLPAERPNLGRRGSKRNRDRTERMVSEAQSRQYWLGRFVTLTNAFHYEDSFHEPDIATGFGMLSSYSRPLVQRDLDTANYRVKRAFMVLENVCLTEEATSSLRRFREEYISRFGGRWIG
ncbi:hypothetical protein PHISCL_00273 [Aspergillus sclerotialis]|uniref:Uncharacterized protein n=1 Tax=Aspergillus sclerotialis TaxID=2070753 RepID=A0A3A3A1E4_9EURO|nr:hypothetical protein PHISCL_00273 [Aspergillus sclerotialis]